MYDEHIYSVTKLKNTYLILPLDWLIDWLIGVLRRIGNIPAM